MRWRDRSKIAGKPDLLPVVDGLISEEQHLVSQQRLTQARNNAWIEILAQIDTGDLGTDQGSGGMELQVRRDGRSVYGQ
jgi:hypothetical protein